VDWLPSASRAAPYIRVSLQFIDTSQFPLSLSPPLSLSLSLSLVRFRHTDRTDGRLSISPRTLIVRFAARRYEPPHFASASS